MNKVVAQVMRPPMAIFDFDSTLVIPREGRPFPKNADDWMWLRPNVPEIVRDYAKTHQIVIVTDQTKAFKLDMIKTVLAEIGCVATVVVGHGVDKKPATRMFYEAVGHSPLSPNTFYVGDAAGRPGDWSNVDLEFAKAIGVEFRVPEVVFPGAPVPAVVKKLPKAKAVKAVKAANDEAASAAGEGTIVIMVGYPGSGKSTYIKNNFAGYTVIEGDVYKTQPKMLKAALKVIADVGGGGGHPNIVFDATNPTPETRTKYVAFAKEQGYTNVKCVWIKTTIEEAIAGNLQRGEAAVPRIALAMFKKRFIEPTEDEGYSLVVIERQ